MDTNKLKKEAKEDYLVILKRIEIGCEIGNIVETLLPNDWKIGFSGYTIEFVCYTADHPKEEFKFVCGLVEKAINKKLTRNVSQYGGTYYGLNADGCIEFEHNKKIEYVWVRVYLGKPKGCEVEVIEETRKFFKVTDACLGIGDVNV